MATNIDVTIHPDPAEVAVRRYPDRGAGAFSTINIGEASIFIDRRFVLDALQAALDEIRADMDARGEGSAAAS